MPKPGEQKEENQEEIRSKSEPGQQPERKPSIEPMGESGEPETDSDRLMRTLKNMEVLTKAFGVIGKHAKEKMKSDPYMKTLYQGIGACYYGLNMKWAELTGEELDDASIRLVEKDISIPPEKMYDFFKKEHEGKTNYQICRDQLKERDKKTFDKALKGVSDSLNLGINLEELQSPRKQEEKKEEAKPEKKKEEKIEEKKEEKNEERRPEEKKEERKAEEKKAEAGPEEKKEEQGQIGKNEGQEAPKAQRQPDKKAGGEENIQGIDANVMELVKNLSVFHGYLSLAEKNANAIPAVYDFDENENIYDYKRDTLARKMTDFLDVLSLTAADFTGAAISKDVEEMRQELPTLDKLGGFLSERDADGKTNFHHIIECLPEGMEQPFTESVQALSKSLQLGINANALLKEARARDTRDRAETWKKQMGFDRNEEKTAQEWIERETGLFKKKKWDRLELTDGKIPEDFAKSCARIMAARMLTDAKRGKKSSLGTSMLWDTLDKKADELMEDSTFQNFMKRACEDPEFAEKIQKAVGKGHAGGLEDAFKEYVRELPPGELDNKPILKRYMPTAKERIESLQVQARNAAENHKTALIPNDKQMYAMSMKRAAAEIIQLRNMAKAEWGRKKSVDKPIPVQGQREGEPEVPDLKGEVRALAGNKAMEGVLLRQDVQELLGKGHGGLMAEQIRKAAPQNSPDVMKNSIQGQIAALKEKAGELNAALQEGKDVEAEARTVISQYCILTEAAGKKGENANRDAPWDSLDKMKDREMNGKVIAAVAGKNFVKNGLTENLGEILSHVAAADPTKFKEAVKMTVEAGKGKQRKAPAEPERNQQEQGMGLGA